MTIDLVFFSLLLIFHGLLVRKDPELVGENSGAPLQLAAGGLFILQISKIFLVLQQLVQPDFRQTVANVHLLADQRIHYLVSCATGSFERLVNRGQHVSNQRLLRRQLLLIHLNID